MNVVFVEQLDQQLRDIEASAREYDAGNKDAAIRIARCLRQIFDHTAKSTSLLAQLQARFTRLLSSVDKPPYPQERYSPLAEIEVKFTFPAIHTGARPQNQPIVDPPAYRPMLERKKLTRQVQAPDWWGNEPVMIVQRKKVTRKAIVLGTSAGETGSDGPGTMLGESPGSAPKVDDAHFAALRQMAYEVLKSPELLKLAGR
jgi:hypothetical protein